MTEPVPRVVADGNIGPVDATRVPRYAGEATFARLPSLAEVPRADVAVLGVPFDSGVSYRPGARHGDPAGAASVAGLTRTREHGRPRRHEGGRP